MSGVVFQRLEFSVALSRYVYSFSGMCLRCTCENLNRKFFPYNEIEIRSLAYSNILLYGLTLSLLDMII